MTPLPPALALTAKGELLHLSPEELETTVSMLEARGCDIRRIELDGTTDKAEMFKRTAFSLTFPEWFGHNWDALADCLSDLSWLPAVQERALLITGLDTMSPNGRTLLELLADLTDDTSVQWLLISP